MVPAMKAEPKPVPRVTDIDLSFPAAFPTRASPTANTETSFIKRTGNPFSKPRRSAIDTATLQPYNFSYLATPFM